MVDGKVVHQLEKREVEQYIEDGTIYGGMIPKVTSAMSALDKGLIKCHDCIRKSNLF